MTRSTVGGWRILGLSTVATQRPGVTNSYEVAPSKESSVEIFVYETGLTTFRITEQSTDDTSPQSEIRYEALTRQVYGDNHAYYAYDSNLPLEFDDSVGHVTFPRWMRAVDEAGNRSEIVTPEFILIDG